MALRIRVARQNTDLLAGSIVRQGVLVRAAALQRGPAATNQSLPGVGHVTHRIAVRVAHRRRQGLALGHRAADQHVTRSVHIRHRIGGGARQGLGMVLRIRVARQNTHRLAGMGVVGNDVLV